MHIKDAGARGLRKSGRKPTRTAMGTTIMLDVRGLEPPEPMERVLGALSTLGPDQQLLMIIDRQPRPLYRILLNNGYDYRETFKPEGIFEILIWQAR